VSTAPRPGSGPTVEVTVFGCDPDEARVFRERAPYFGITPVLTAEPVAVGTARLAAGSACVSVGHKASVSPAVLDALADAGVRYLSTRSIGVDHIDLSHARRRGITVENAPYGPDGVADYTLMLLLMAVRQAKSVLRRADLHDYRLPETRGRELRELTVGVVGTGRIGTAVVERLRGFGCRVLASDRRPAPALENVPLEELLERSDVVTVHAPLDATTHHLIDAGGLARMKPGAFLVNTSRGGLVDSVALLAALEDGRLGGVALDVHEDEDGVFYADHRQRAHASAALARLQELPNAIVTPHTAYFTERVLTDTVVATLINCLRFEKGLRHD